MERKTVVQNKAGVVCGVVRTQPPWRLCAGLVRRGCAPCAHALKLLCAGVVRGGCAHNPWLFITHWSYKALCASSGTRQMTPVNNRFCALFFVDIFSA